MPHLRIVESREAERITLVEVVPLHVELAAGDELAAEHRGVHAVLPAHDDLDIGTVSLQRVDDVGRHFVAGLEAAVVEGHFVALLDVVGAARGGRQAVLVHELGLAVFEREAGIFRAARVALAAGIGAGFRVVAGVVGVLVVDMAPGRRAAALHVPHVQHLAFAARVLVAIGLAFAHVAGHRAALLLEIAHRVADGPQHGPLVLVVDVVVTALVGGVLQLFPGAVGLLLVGAAADGIRGVGVLDQHVHRVGGVDGLDLPLGLALAAGEVHAVGQGHGHRLRLGPHRVGGAGVHVRCCGDLEGDQRIGRHRLLRRLASGQGEGGGGQAERRKFE